MRRWLSLTTILLSVAGASARQPSEGSQELMQQLFRQSEHLRDIGQEWRRVWFQGKTAPSGRTTSAAGKRFVEKIIEPSVEIHLRVGMTRLWILKQTPSRVAVPRSSVISAQLIDEKILMIQPRKVGVTALTQWPAAAKGKPAGDPLMFLVRVTENGPKGPALSEPTAGMSLPDSKPVPMKLTVGVPKIVRSRKAPTSLISGVGCATRDGGKVVEDAHHPSTVRATFTDPRTVTLTARRAGRTVITMLFENDGVVPQIRQYDVTAK